MRAPMSVVALVFATSAVAAQEATIETSNWECSPTKIAQSPDPVTKITLDLKIEYQGNLRPKVTWFDASHRTASFSNSEQRLQHAPRVRNDNSASNLRTAI
jgi:hypothetical protein